MASFLNSRVIIMCHRKLRTTNSLLKLDRTLQWLLSVSWGWTKNGYRCTGSQISYPWGQSPCPAGICILSLFWKMPHHHHSPGLWMQNIGALEVNPLLQSLIFRSQLNVTKPSLWPSGIILLPTHSFMTRICPLITVILGFKILLKILVPEGRGFSSFLSFLLPSRVFCI